MRAALVPLVVAGAVLFAETALAAYSAPLTRVRIDAARVTHTPTLVFVTDESGGDSPFDTTGYGAQYILQLEWASGLGVQAGAFAARADVTMRPSFLAGAELDASGLLYGGQLRGYYNVWTSGPGPAEGGARPHALTSFVNLRAVQLSAGGTDARLGRDRDVDLAQLQVSAGVGLMGELALGPWFSFCPYAWFSPLLRRDRRLSSPDSGSERDSSSMDLTRPLRTGADLWFYPYGASSESHVALSAIVSLVDTSGEGKQESAYVLSYSFSTP